MRRSQALSGAIGALVFGVTALLLPAHGDTDGWSVPVSPVLPAPSGSNPVGVRHHVMTTRSADPWKPGKRRAVMVDLHYPAAADDHPLSDYYRANYMSELGMLEWAPNEERRLGLAPNAVNWAFRVHSHEWAPPARRRMPVVVVSSPPGTMRTQFTHLAEDLASHGFLVVTVDHPHDAPVVELFPTRKVITDHDASAVTRSEMNSLRVNDIEHVVHHLEKIDPDLSPHADDDQIGLMGWLGATVEHGKRLASLPGVRASVALAPSGSVAERSHFPGLLVLRSTPLETLSDNAELLAQVRIGRHRSGAPSGGDASTRYKASRALGLARAHLLDYLGTN